MDIEQRIADVLRLHRPAEVIWQCGGCDWEGSLTGEDPWTKHVASVLVAELGLEQEWSNDVAGPEWMRYSRWVTKTEKHPGPRRLAAGLDQ